MTILLTLAGRLATLPITVGCIGLATLTDTALPAYSASLTASRELAGRILSNLPESDLSSEQEVVCQRSTAAGFNIDDHPKSQRRRTKIAGASKLADVRSTIRPKLLAHVAATTQLRLAKSNSSRTNQKSS